MLRFALLDLSIIYACFVRYAVFVQDYVDDVDGSMLYFLTFCELIVFIVQRWLASMHAETTHIAL